VQLAQQLPQQNSSGAFQPKASGDLCTWLNCKNKADGGCGIAVGLFVEELMKVASAQQGQP
jgi:hypothetical protein